MAKNLESSKLKPLHKRQQLLTQAFEDEIKGQGFDLVVGIDEAGRGPLAGPVVASAVVVNDFNFTHRIADSKKLSPEQRSRAYLEILDKSFVGVGIISEAVIDRVNILEATFLAMNAAVVHLLDQIQSKQAMDIDFQKVCLLVDGNKFKTEHACVQKTIVGGDNKVFSIACASIIAKVTRDRILNIYDKVFPQYGFAQHKGYPTESHRKAIKSFGPSAIHRFSFQF